MSYLVLARKWRPRNFAETTGQEHVLKALTNALDSERLHHAYLFTGTRGVGKTTIARILAKSLNCETGITSKPCGVCSACREIDEGRFVDLIEVDAASKTKVDDTRELLDNVQYTPARGRFKIYLIDEVHMLSKNSFNALLKTLEEPPPHVKFLLATTDPQKLPVTVLSRCLQFNLKRLTPKLIRDRLEYICREEPIGADAVSLSMIARAADGSLRDALSLLDQAVAHCGGALTEDAVASMLGTIDREHVAKLLGLLAAGDAPGLLGTVAAIDEQAPDYARLLEDLARLLQRIAVYQVAGITDSEDDFGEQEIAELAQALAAEDVQLFYQTALIGRRDLHLAPDPRSGTEMTLLRMLAFRPARGAGGAEPGGARLTGDPGGHRRAARETGSYSATRGRDAPAQAVGAGAPSGGRETASVPVRTAWQAPDWARLIPELELNGASKLLASNCAYVRRKGDVIHLALDSRSESLLTRARQNELAAALSRHFGESLTIDIDVGQPELETPMQEKERLDQETLEAARESLESDPNVKALRDMFGAELNPDSIELVNSHGSNGSKR
ncbi:MAG TPA: DNA polymerase III subunit gamma/tau [Woeseiaceae bacterium]|nr:DNA polymerase III subunit gamma/tau [Woeseiaceae bacterium]